MGNTLGLGNALRCFLALATLSCGLLAQVETARITGLITDPTGAVVPNARVSLQHLATGTTSTLTTDAQGRYLSLPLRIGEYRVEVEALGFKRAVRSGVTVQIQETAALNFALDLGATSESVDVTASAPLLSTAEGSQGQVIDNRRIVDMPLNGRDYIQLALLSAGTTAHLGGRFQGFSAAGQRTAQNNYLLDGIDNNNVQLAAQGDRAEAVKPSVDAIQEFKISTNSYSAEYGRAMGGVVNATIKSGSNDFHGTMFEFLRNEKLDAKNFFDDPDEPKPSFKRNQYGFSVGGPIWRNKTFFFGDYEWTKIRESRTVNNTIPTLAQRSGDFRRFGTIYDPNTYNAASRTRQPFPNNTIPTNRIDRVAAQAANWYPTPQNDNLTQNFLFNPPDSDNVGKWDLRVDHNFSEKDLVYFRFSYQNNFTPASPNLPAAAYSSASTNTTNDGRNTALVWSHVFSPSLVTTSRIGWNQLFTNEEPAADKNASAEIGLRGVNQTTPGSPRFAISNYQALGIGPNLPNLNDSQTRQLISDTNWIRGGHTLKFGINFMWTQAFITNPKEGLGVFDFNGNFTRNPSNNSGGQPFADFLLGIPVQTSVARDVYANLRAPLHQFYVHDEWRVTARLTLNLGLRYELNGNFLETRNQQSNYDIDAGLAAGTLPGVVLARADSRDSRALLRTDKNNWAPRFGFAYTMTPKTVLRGGYGIFFGNYEGTGGGRHLLGNPPNTISVIITTDNVTPAFLLQDGVPAGTLDPRNLSNLRLTSFVANPDWPSAHQWNLNVQREVWTNTVWEAGYYGAKAVHLPVRWNGNYALPGAGNVNARRRFTSIVYPETNVVVSPLAIVDRHDYFGNSQFHSLQTRLERRFSGGFTITGFYTFSRSIGDTSGFSAAGTPPGSPQGFQNPLNRRLEKSLDDQHQKHRFVASYLYELPFGRARRFGGRWNRAVDGVLGGWSLGGITTLASGQPQGVTVQGNPANTGDPNRPNVVGDPKLSHDERTLDRFFNTAAFVPNAQFTYGNAGRNILEQPGSVNFDFAAFKQFQFTEQVGAQFRFEVFNFFNTPQFGAPNSQLLNINFGRITEASRPRNLQFGLKIRF